MDALDELGKLNIRSILCEGGAELASSLIEADLVDRLILISCPFFSADGLDFKVKHNKKFVLKFSTRINSDSLSIYDREN